MVTTTSEVQVCLHQIVCEHELGGYAESAVQFVRQHTAAYGSMFCMSWPDGLHESRCTLQAVPLQSFSTLPAGLATMMCI